MKNLTALISFVIVLVGMQPIGIAQAQAEAAPPGTIAQSDQEPTQEAEPDCD